MVLPLDEYMELSGLPYKITNQMMLKIAYYAQNQASFEAAVNTRVEDTNGSTRRENKTVMAFTDKNIRIRGDGSKRIEQKEYAAFIGPVEEFKKYVLKTTINEGYYKNPPSRWIFHKTPHIYS